MVVTLYPVALWSVDGIGLKTFRKVEHFLHQHSLSWEEWWTSDMGVWWASGLRPHQQAALGAFKTRYTPESYWEELASKNIWVMSENDPLYPSLLKPIPDRPPILFGKGTPKIDPKTIAVVGTRHITSYGRQVTTQLVKQLVANQVTIVSGFMYGVDAVAQETAHQVGGQTVGILGYGFDHLYPRSQKPLFETLLAGNQTFLTEYAPHVAPNQGTFICRNRIIAGLSQATVVTEAGIKSGSHGTANWALEYGRSVCAVPGPITNPYSQGTKGLINQGARMVDSAEDILDEVGWKAETPLALDASATSGQHRQVTAAAAKIMSELAQMRQSLEQLTSNSGLPMAEIRTTLAHLELAEQVKKEGPFWTLW